MDDTSASSSTQGSCSVRPIKTFKRKNISNPEENPGGDEDEIISNRESTNQRMLNLVNSEEDKLRMLNWINNEEDKLLSILDEDLLLHVLSFLPTMDAIRTCILSKRWKSLWTRIPCLRFNLYGTPFRTVDEFVSFVDKTLTHNRCSKIFKFLLNFQGFYCSQKLYLDSEVLDRWTLFATKVGVEELSLLLYEFLEDCNLNCNYALPSHILECSTLTKLYLSHCNLVPHPVITWTMLKSLSINKTKLSDDVIQKVLSGSPALEVLEIRRCIGLSRLDITSASLRKLVIEENWIRNNIDGDAINFAYGCLDIYAPNIKELEILGFIMEKCQLVDVSSLVNAHLVFELANWPEIFVNGDETAKYYRESQNILRELLNGVRLVKKLTLGSWCFQIVTKFLKVNSLHSPLSECKNLILKARIRARKLLDMARLLQNFPHLETLTIVVSSCFCTEDFMLPYIVEEGKMIPWGSKDFEQILNSLVLNDLKIVKIVGSRMCNERQILSLAELLLRNSRVLEKMVFLVSKKVCYTVSNENGNCKWVTCRYDTEGLQKISHKLQGFPRSSPHVNIMVSW